MKQPLLFSKTKFLAFSNLQKSRILLKQFFSLEQKIFLLENSKEIEIKVLKKLLNNLIENLSLIEKISFDCEFKKLIETIDCLKKIKIEIENLHFQNIKSLWQRIEKVFLPLSKNTNFAKNNDEIIDLDIAKNRDNFLNQKEKTSISFWLHNLRSCYNVAAIIRLAEGLGVEKIYFTGYTPLPTHEKISKYSMAASLFISWEQKEQKKMINFLTKNNYQKIALETEKIANKISKEKSVDIFEDFIHRQSEEKIENKINNKNQKKVLLFGNERFGIEKEILYKMDQIFFIPMNGYKNSINVALTAAIAGFYFTAKNKILRKI